MPTLAELECRIGLLEHTYPYRTFALIAAAVVAITAFNIWAHVTEDRR